MPRVENIPSLTLAFAYCNWAGAPRGETGAQSCSLTKRAYFCTMSFVQPQPGRLPVPRARPMMSGAKWAQTSIPEGPKDQQRRARAFSLCNALPSLMPFPAHLTSPSLLSSGCGSMRHRHGVLIPVCILGAEGKCLVCLPAPHVRVTLAHAANQFALVPAPRSRWLCQPHHSMAMVTGMATHAMTNPVTNNPFVSAQCSP